MKNFITDWNRGEWQSIEAAYEEYRTICLHRGLNSKQIPCIQTLRNWIKKLPAVEQRGKFKPSRQKYIKKGLAGTYEEGRYPGAIIQMDHTLLDIWLVDSFTKQPMGRPWITAGIDVFSRNIWCFYLSFENPSQESVLNAVVNGIIPKSNLSEWKLFQSNCEREGYSSDKYELVCAGYPSLIQTDNGKDFQAKIIKEFFMKQNITLEFRPTYTPNYGGYVEAPWNTINNAIRGAKLPGRGYSLPKTRDVASNRKIKNPPRYDAKKNAKLTLEEFREWLFSYFTVRYCAKIKSSQNQSPNEIWRDGLTGDRFQPMGGALRIATSQELERLRYLCKRKVIAKVNEKGLRYKNIYYTAPFLIDARKKGTIQGMHEFRVSHLDIRFAYMIDPITRKIETLQAYNYKGDDRILAFIKNGVRKGGHPITMHMLENIKEKIGESDYDSDEGLLFMDFIGQKMQKKKKITQKELRFLETVAKSQEGRSTMAEAVKTIQRNEEGQDYLEHLQDQEILKSIDLDMVEDEVIEGCETDWKIVKSKLNWSEDFYKSEKEEGE